MADQYMIKKLHDISLAMFRKNFFGIYHGSISARVDIGSFLINTKEAIFDEITETSFIELYTQKEDYRWSVASIDAHIHSEIYTQIPHAKYIAYAMPPYATAYTLGHDIFVPSDYFGSQIFAKTDIYDTHHFDDWYDRAPYEIANFFKNNSRQLILVKGYGVYTYDRDLSEIAKRIAILENSARLLMLNNS
jgi:L-fuculose-phosphate aldolase